MLYKAGDDALACAKWGAANDGSQMLRRLGFIDSPWGKKACLLMKTTLRLKDKHWSLVVAYSYAYIKGNSDDEGSVDEGKDEAQPHAFLELEWCIFFPSQQAYILTCT